MYFKNIPFHKGMMLPCTVKKRDNFVRSLITGVLYKFTNHFVVLIIASLLFACVIMILSKDMTTLMPIKSSPFIWLVHNQLSS